MSHVKQAENKRAVDFDVVIIGGGHAGVEAALAVARMGLTAAIITMDRRKLGLMSCNPAIGGVGKSQLVKEIDALGGIMAQAIDATGIQFRRLNLSRGAAVWSTRAQADRIKYNEYVVHAVEAEAAVEVVEGLAGELVVEEGLIVGVALESGERIGCRAAVVATGTFLGGLIHIGEKKIRAGRIGEPGAWKLSESFRGLGFEVGRLKTGTPPRLDGDTIDWSRCQLQPGETPIPFFSDLTERPEFEQTPCHLTKTTDKTKALILDNIHRSPMFSGQIKSTGPRYCPSIEDKFYRFREKSSHQLFLEPEGNGTNEIYPNGFSTSLPEDIQLAAIRTVIGLEEIEMTRPGYAVEYDYCPAHQVFPSLETRLVRGLFLAGQINGTSGYEEAAAQGLIAGVNAALFIMKEQPFVLDRSEAYIGVMIDDLVTRSTTEPYRMFTSRAEYRMHLREDNARERLFGHARRLGLISEARYNCFVGYKKLVDKEIQELHRARVQVQNIDWLAGRFKRSKDVSLAGLLKMPGVTVEQVMPLVAGFNGQFSHDPLVLRQAAIEIKYAGYIAKQKREISRFQRLERETIPREFDFDGLTGLKAEAKEKFKRFRPGSIGQASRLEGVTPGDVAVLSVHIRRFKGK